MALQIARKEYARGRPNRAGNGSRGSRIRHSFSVTSLGYAEDLISRFYPAPAPLPTFLTVSKAVINIATGDPIGLAINPVSAAGTSIAHGAVKTFLLSPTVEGQADTQKQIGTAK